MAIWRDGEDDDRFGLISVHHGEGKALDLGSPGACRTGRTALRKTADQLE